MGGGDLPHIPDWRTYTVGEHTPELLKTQRMLKSLGLKVICQNGLLSSVRSSRYRPPTNHFVIIS